MLNRIDPSRPWYHVPVLAGVFAALSCSGLSAANAAEAGRAPLSCSSDIGCGNADSDVCGESAEGCSESCYAPLNVAAFFDHFAGDESVLKCLKNQSLGGLTYSVGGELRYRYMDERNRLRPGGPGQSAYDLWRVTPWVQMNHGDVVSGYVQAIDASIFGLDAPYTALPIDKNRADLLQAYVDLNLGEVGEGQLHYRYGRQFLQYGGQRLLSPLAWSNTFRNFEGHKLMYTSDDWNIDAFGMQSVNGVAGNVFRPTSFDTADSSRWIAGIYSTYKGIQNNAVDFYYLFLDEQDPSPALMDGTRHTLGMRIAGQQPVKQSNTLVGTWNWDVEGAWQFGQDDFGSAEDRDVQAGMFGAIGGYTFEGVFWKPGLGGIFYWGSGDNDPTTGTINTFSTLYPLGHAHWGQIDNFSGQNLLNYGVQASLKPHAKLNVVGQWHYFDLANPSDAIYNIAGAALPGSGARHVGNELDLVGTYTHSKSFNLQAGYFWFFYGAAVNGGALARPDAEQFYLQATYLF